MSDGRPKCLSSTRWKSSHTSPARAFWRECVPSWREGGVNVWVQRISSFPLAVSAEWRPTRVGYLLEDGYVPRQNFDFCDTLESSGFVKNKSPRMKYRRDQVEYSILGSIPWHFNSWICMGRHDNFNVPKWRHVWLLRLALLHTRKPNTACLILRAYHLSWYMLASRTRHVDNSSIME